MKDLLICLTALAYFQQKTMPEKAATGDQKEEKSALDMEVIVKRVPKKLYSQLGYRMNEHLFVCLTWNISRSRKAAGKIKLPGKEYAAYGEAAEERCP